MILRGQRLYDAPVACSGLMFIGDPHISSNRPGRRLETDWPEPIFRKLEAAVEIAIERNLAILLLGDLFDEQTEKLESLKTRLTRLFNRCPIVPISNVGNHDIGNARLSDGDSLALMAEANTIDVCALSGPVCEFLVDGKRLGLGMTPYGQEIPRSVEGLFPDAQSVIWLTHHDMGFDGAYPGALDPFEIEGCKLAVNGHMHLEKTPMRVGQTLWFNPGNINRQSVDLIDHVPAAWILGPDGSLDRHPLPHAREAFDLVGKFVSAASERQVAAAVETAFVSLLMEAEGGAELARSSDGSIMTEEIEAKFTRDKTSKAVQALVRSLLAEAVARRGGRPYEIPSIDVAAFE